MKVVHLCISFEVGGTERLVSDLLRSLKATGEVEPTLVVVNDRFEPRLLAELETAAIPVLTLNRAPGSRSPSTLLKLIAAVRRIRPDLVHVHDPVSEVLAFGLKLAMPRLSVLATVHNTGLVPNYQNWQIRAANLLKVRYAAVSNAVAAECLSRGLMRVSVVHNGIATDRFVVPRPPRRGTVGLVCVARLMVRQKGQDVLLRALRMCVDMGHDMRCTLVGGAIGGDDDRGLLRRIAEELDLGSRVEFVHGLTDVAPELAKADIFVLPSRFEGFGIAAVEAMAASLPVVASDVDGLREVIQPGVNGLLTPPEEPQALAEALLALSTDITLADRLVAAGRASAERYSIRAMHQAYLTAYRSA